MTSNGSEEVNQSQSNQVKKAQNGVSQMRCVGSMAQGVSSARRSNRNSHNSMGLKRLRSVDPAAGMLFENELNSMWEVLINYFLINDPMNFST